MSYGLSGMSEYLYERGLFILGDSAYAIESFLLPPYDSPLSQSPEDNYNFFHSSQRFTVECVFGEIDLRWGIFWKRLWNSVDTSIMICEGAIHLHNLFVDQHKQNTFRKISLNASINFYKQEI